MSPKFFLIPVILFPLYGTPVEATDLDDLRLSNEINQSLQLGEQQLHEYRTHESIPAILAPQVQVNELYYSDSQNPASPVYLYNPASGQVDRVR